MMIVETGLEGLKALVTRQAEHIFSLNRSEEEILLVNIDRTIERCEFCFRHNSNKYYSKNGTTYFNPFHSAQYAIFLYYLSNNVWLENPANTLVADKIYYLNRMLNGVDLFYQVRMPDIFFLDHPVGSVMGRATYGNYFTFCQSCTVGNNKGRYPVIGEHVTMMAGAMIIGCCNIGDNVVVSAKAYVKDCDIPAGSLVFGAHPDLIVKPRRDVQ